MLHENITADHISLLSMYYSCDVYRSNLRPRRDNFVKEDPVLEEVVP